VASYGADAVTWFTRNASTGLLSAPVCIEDQDTGGPGGDDCGASPDIDGLEGAHGVAVSPDNKNVYVASDTDSAIVTFTRDLGTGALTAAGCFDDPAPFAACGGNTTPGLKAADGVAVSPDGKSVYVAAAVSKSIVRFNRDTGTGAL